MCDIWHVYEILYWSFRAKITDNSPTSAAFGQASIMVIKAKNRHIEGCAQCQEEERRLENAA